MTWILVLLLLLCALYLLFLYGIFRLVFWNSDARKKRGPALPKGPGYDDCREEMEALVHLMEEQVPTEQIRIMAEDGTILCGRYYAGEEDAPVEILFHGYRGGAVRDMCGAHRIAREHGIATILVDERAHGESGGNVTTFGIRERRDVLSWARYAEERFGKERPLILSGVSMGAAAVLMAAGEPLPENVCGIVADCPFSSPEAIIRTVMKGMHVSFLWPSVALSALLFGHFSLTQSSALSGVQNTDLPILLIHGEADDFVPAQMSRDLARAGKRVSLFLFPGAAHGISYLTDTERYTQAEMDWIAAITGWKTAE